MKKNFKDRFSSASTLSFEFASRAKRRLMLGLTARHVRAVGERSTPVLSSSGFRMGSALLDYLQPTLTRYHE